MTAYNSVPVRRHPNDDEAREYARAFDEIDCGRRIGYHLPGLVDSPIKPNPPIP